MSDAAPLDPAKLAAIPEDAWLGARIVLHPALRLLQVRYPVADLRRKLKQALINLCKNGVEAMAEGGLLRIRVSKVDGYVVLEVSDTGPGLPEGLDVFEPFVTTKEHGTGLGLSVVREIALAHGGTISYNSEPGKGTSFCMMLPIKQ